MSFFKELFTLVKLLFTKISDPVEIKMLPMKHFPFKGYMYMMWCGHLIYRSEYPQFANPDLVDLNHELIHVAQASDCGSWINYYLRYSWSWLMSNPVTPPSNSAYYTNKYEVEAYAKEDDLTYLGRRTKGMVEKYKLLYPKKFYKSCGNSYYFKKEVKDMFSEY